MGLRCLCPRVAFSPREHWWLAVGYELIQDHDAIGWKSVYAGHKPIDLAAVPADAWYQGGPVRWGFPRAIGPLLISASSAFSGASRYFGGDTDVLDMGADASFGDVRGRVRPAAFGNPAWFYGRIASPAGKRRAR
jgi:hypothetical protein